MSTHGSTTHAAAVNPNPERWALLEKVLAAFDELFSRETLDAIGNEVRGLVSRLAGVWNERFVRALYASLRDSYTTGQGVREWLPAATALIKAYGGAKALGIYGPGLDGEGLSAWYADLVFRQNTMNALNAGRYSEMFFGPAFADSPYWLYATAEDERVCPICGPLDGKVFEKADRTAWRLLPTLHFNCRCQAIELDAAAIRAGKYDVTRGDALEVQPDDGFGGLSGVPETLRRAA